jgi:hypothetical protein
VFFGLLVSPLTTIAGTVYGALAAQSPEEVDSAARTLQTVGQAAEVQAHLRDLVIARLAREGYRDVSALGQAAGARPPVETVVQVWINEITLVGTGVNPRLTLRLAGDMRVLRAGVEVGYLWVSSEGPHHTLLQWAADDAALFRAQLGHESDVLAETIVNTLLSRPLPTHPAGPRARHGTITSIQPGVLVVTGRGDGQDATWTFVVDATTVIRKDGEEVTAADLKPGEPVVVYFASDSTVAQLIAVRIADAPPHPTAPARPAKE